MVIVFPTTGDGYNPVPQHCQVTDGEGVSERLTPGRDNELTPEYIYLNVSNSDIEGQLVSGADFRHTYGDHGTTVGWQC